MAKRGLSFSPIMVAEKLKKWYVIFMYTITPV